MTNRLLILPVVLLCASAAAADYQPGFVWDRFVDWTPGTTPGTSAGNADDDLAGSPVWFYGNIKGGDGLGSPNPWYTGAATAQVWDNDWTGAIGNQAWARNFNGVGEPKIGANPPITRGNLIHDLSQNTGSWDYKPAIRWINPAGNGTNVDIVGDLTATWNGFGLTTYPDIPVEVAFARFDASAGSYDLLYSYALSNPLAGAVYSSAVRVPIPDLDLKAVRFDEGDFLVFSVRGVSGPVWPASWVGLTDDFSITLVSQVPEPSVFAMTLAGVMIIGVAMWRRRTP